MQALIPAPPGPGDIPVGPERPEPLRVTPPPAAAMWDELEEIRRKVEDFAERLKSFEERLSRLEGHKH